MSSNSLNNVTKTLTNRIWNAIKDDKQLQKIIKTEDQISVLSPRDADKKSAVSVFLYNVTELSSMRNQPQPQTAGEPRTLLYLNLQYLITPLTSSVEDDQIVLGKIMQLFAEKPVLRGAELQGSLSENNSDELRVTLDALDAEALNTLWTMLQTPYKLCVSYTVRPVRIVSSTTSEKKPSLPKNTKVQTIKR